MSNLIILDMDFSPDEEEAQRLEELQMAMDSFHEEFYAVYVKNQFSISKKEQTHKELRSVMFIVPND